MNLSTKTAQSLEPGLSLKRYNSQIVFKENRMTSLIKLIQKSLEYGRPVQTKTGPISAQILKEILKEKASKHS